MHSSANNTLLGAPPGAPAALHSYCALVARLASLPVVGGIGSPPPTYWSLAGWDSCPYIRAHLMCSYLAPAAGTLHCWPCTLDICWLMSASCPLAERPYSDCPLVGALQPALFVEAVASTFFSSIIDVDLDASTDHLF